NGVFCLSWENTQVSFPIETNTNVWAEQKIQTGLKEKPNDAGTLSLVAFYYEMNNKKLDEAYGYVKKAMTLKEDRWFYRLAVDISMKQKDYGEAIKMANAGISFLERTHPQEWEESVRQYKNDIRRIAAMK
ncbi:MAG TPA: hypothetical protein VKQ08_07280, partial [Cyclobacteriaceae bacterium]|nr:hypothetical protein [Cyclobacteriaceae bacterium]